MLSFTFLNTDKNPPIHLMGFGSYKVFLIVFLRVLKNLAKMIVDIKLPIATVSIPGITGELFRSKSSITTQAGTKPKRKYKAKRKIKSMKATNRSRMIRFSPLTSLPKNQTCNKKNYCNYCYGY